MATIIIVILWAAMGLFCIIQNQEQLEQMTVGRALAAFSLLVAFGPCFVIVTVVQGILGWLGWEDEDDDGHGV